MTSIKITLKSALTLLLFIASLSEAFAQVNPIPGIGVVIKKNPGGGAHKVVTRKDGGFSIQLSSGDYVLTPDNKVLTSVLGAFIKSKNSSIIKPDNAGVEITLDKTSNVTVKLSYPIVDDIYRTSKTAIEINFTVPEEGAKVSGKLNWNDGVISNIPILPNSPLGSVQ